MSANRSRVQFVIRNPFVQISVATEFPLWQCDKPVFELGILERFSIILGHIRMN
jgi:hypothetical protein